MPIKTADTQDAIPEALRAGSFETKDGKWVYDEPEDTSALKGALAKERARADAAEKAAKAAADAATAADLEKRGLLEAKKEWDEKVLAPVASKLAALETENRTMKLQGPVQKMLAEAGALNLDHAWKLFGDQFDLSEDGKPILKSNPTADISKHIAETLTKEAPGMFRGTGADGSDSKGGKPFTGKSIAASDTKAFLDNVDGIAKGEVVATL